MKTKMLFIAVGLAAVGALFIPREAVGQQPEASERSAVSSPLGQECVVTVETQAWMKASPTQPDSKSGFYGDYTLRGKIIQWQNDWIVLKDGSYENWIPREKVLSVRVSR